MSPLYLSFSWCDVTLNYHIVATLLQTWGELIGHFIANWRLGPFAHASLLFKPTMDNGLTSCWIKWNKNCVFAFVRLIKSRYAFGIFFSSNYFYMILNLIQLFFFFLLKWKSQNMSEFSGWSLLMSFGFFFFPHCEVVMGYIG